MGELFLKFFNMSISASGIIFAVLLLRLVLKKAPKTVNIILWGLVALRLGMFFPIESSLSLAFGTETVERSVLTDENVLSSIAAGTTNPGGAFGSVTDYPVSSTSSEGVSLSKLFFDVFPALWLVGAAVMAAYAVLSYIGVKRKVRTAVLLRENIYQSENIVSPFVLGIVKPKIYLPFNITEGDMSTVIAHETAHIKRRDYLWKPLGFAILTVHWFNALVWLSYILFCKDTELACDEKVIKNMSANERADYSQTLLNFSVSRKGVSACPLAFGEVGVKNRMKSILNYKKPAFWIVLVAVILIVVTAVCFLTNPAGNTLQNIEFLNIKGENIAGVVLREGSSVMSNGISEELKEELLSIKISSKEASPDRSETRDTSYTVVLQTEEQQLLGKGDGLKIHFNGEFSRVWVDNGVKPTLSYRIISPESARNVYEKLKSYVPAVEYEVPLSGKVTVLVWQMAPKSYSCYVVGSDTEAAKAETVPTDFMKNSATVEQVKDFLTRRGIKRENVTVRAVSCPLSSYNYRIDDEAAEKAFWEE